ncbi:bifunctional phosphopantothenoylcysteine decarboxylase/phosphopantothenate--cysteine ligase CoaBC [Reinekea marinisedimentorum]|uniref:Coenzyme A biosynthesis bifunctional protein CoaBC n=1 Tax=Reinekea marinisedimentorum TaxID=230495 RepID=A0A4R3IG34_9GAMM|nr:bifunctional phosphopantothenoylcysteine decarboxylase/phosphopantothenate--cysteine ligase CoaBC [Reinekea marinisedimentorum]TCS43962.1 phosphopantothenoylcysteine decarboxylase/phosphopantothenate--cysteine ligase [Reinekea marinisedimentorum]
MSISVFDNKHVVIGITGGIAAYKSAELVRQFIKAGAEVRVVMTESAQEFITPLTLQALSGNPVSTSLFDKTAELGMSHIELAKWADLVVIAPATADTIARINAGMANDLLTTLCLATRAKVAIAPAMNEFMWHHPLTQRNMQSLLEILPNACQFGPAAGEQACGDMGYGRMLEPVEIFEMAKALFQPQDLSGKSLVITAGPTQEAIDPVRYLSNHSSGKMGFALAQAASERGATVTLIAGPVNLATPAGVNRVDVVSASQMYEAALNSIAGCDVFIGTAAVADYRPSSAADQKIKKDGSGAERTITLIENPDILASIGHHENRPATVIGFAAETQKTEQYAADKLQRKNADAIVANDVSRSDIGFGAANNEVLWVSDQQSVPFGPASKRDVAHFILDQILNLGN